MWLHHSDSKETLEKKKLYGNYTRILFAVLNKYRTLHGSYTATYLLSCKLFKYNEQDRLDTAGEIRSNTRDVLRWTLNTWIHQCWPTSKNSLLTPDAV